MSINFFGAEIPAGKFVVPAYGTFCYWCIGGSAIMANEFVVQFMKGQGNITVPALGNPPTDLANLVRRISAAVLKQNYLFISLHRSFYFFDQRR